MNKIFSLADKHYLNCMKQTDVLIKERPFLIDKSKPSVIIETPETIEEMRILKIEAEVLHLELMSALNEYGWR